MEIIFKYNDKNNFNKRWEEYLLNNIVSYRYTLLHLEYYLLYAQHLIFDKSFVVIENNKCVGICFLPIEEIDGIKLISISGGYTISPLSTEKRIEKKIFEKIDTISKELNIHKIQFYLDPLILAYKNKFNLLLEYGFIDSSTTDCLLNLTQSEQDLWKNLRKSYKGLINQTLKNKEFSIEIMNKENSNYSFHESYRNLHYKCAGNTRNKETFDKQFEMLQNNLATIIGLKYKNNFIGFNYFYHHNKTIIYASGADDPEFENSKIPIYHTILWSAILFFKKRNFEYIEFSQPCGFNHINGFDDYLDEKQINISKFKRALGTQMVPFFRGIKYFNQTLLKNDIENFLQKSSNL